MVLHRIGGDMWTAKINGNIFTGDFDTAIAQALNSIS